MEYETAREVGRAVADRVADDGAVTAESFDPGKFDRRRELHPDDAAVGRAMTSWQRSEFRHDGLRTCYLDRLSALSAPTPFVHGTDDPLLPASWSERAADRTGGDLKLFEGCGHWPARERPERFNRTVRQFLGG